MFDWRDILKNQKTFQGLAVGELSEDSLLEEDEKCIPKLMRIIRRLEQKHEKILSDTTLYKKKGSLPKGGMQVHFSTEEFPEVHPKYNLSASLVYAHPDIEKLLTEDFACDIIDYLGQSDKLEVNTDNIYGSLDMMTPNDIRLVIYDFRTTQYLLDAFLRVNHKVSYLPSTKEGLLRLVRP